MPAFSGSPLGARRVLDYDMGDAMQQPGMGGTGGMGGMGGMQ